MNNIIYKEIKELPNDQLYNLFNEVKWTNGEEDEFKLNNFNAPFKNSTIVVSAWDNDKLIGCARVISDKIVRSIIQDLAVLPNYQHKGIGKELLKKCISYYPKSEWLICTIEKNIKFYEKNGFEIHNGPFLSIPSKWF